MQSGSSLGLDLHLWVRGWLQASHGFEWHEVCCRWHVWLPPLGSSWEVSVLHADDSADALDQPAWNGAHSAISLWT